LALRPLKTLYGHVIAADFDARSLDVAKTTNRRISSLSGFFKYLREEAAEMRLPIQVANPADKEFIARDNADLVEERQHFSAAKARLLFGMPAGETILDYRDRAMPKCLIYSGMRISTLLRLDVKDFHYDDHSPRLRISEKGHRRRTIGLHVAATEAIRFTSARPSQRKARCSARALIHAAGSWAPTA
jgi:site-specific recombinase XerD